MIGRPAGISVYSRKLERDRVTDNFTESKNICNSRIYHIDDGKKKLLITAGEAGISRQWKLQRC